MAPKSRSLLFVFLSILVLSILNEATSFSSKRALAGGWKKIDNVKDPEVVKIAKFAVSEHNKQANTNLEFVDVVKGETQVVAGTNYRLVISAKDGAAADPKTYRAVVWSKPWQKFQKLESFEALLG